MEFKDKVVVVTGGAQGIGKCCADSFRREGSTVHVIDIQQGPWFVGDLADKSVLERFSAEVIAKSGHVDVLVNNAMPLFKGIDECTYEEFVNAQAVGKGDAPLTADGVTVAKDDAMRRQLMKEAKLLTELTSPRVLLEAEHKRLTVELMNLPDGPEFNLKNARKDELERQMREVEIQQAENLSDQQVVDLVENAIRSRPEDFPLLTKYYLNA